MVRELDSINKQPGKRATFRSAKLRQQLDYLEKRELPNLQKNLDFAEANYNKLKSGYSPEQIAKPTFQQELRNLPAESTFRLTKEEWDSLWSKPLTSREVGNLVEMQTVVRNDIGRESRAIFYGFCIFKSRRKTLKRSRRFSDKSKNRWGYFFSRRKRKLKIVY